MSIPLLLATQNQGKIAEFEQMLLESGLDKNFAITQQQDFDQNIGEVAETGQTFAQNALIKAKAYADFYQTLALAEDSGLVVNGLNNFPGVKSNRWLAGSDSDRNLALIKKLEAKKTKDWSASYRAAICLYSPFNGQHWLFEGQVDGTLIKDPVGNYGFGYDPLFIPKNFDKTFAQLGMDVKNQISHRAKALQKLINFLKTTDNDQFNVSTS